MSFLLDEIWTLKDYHEHGTTLNDVKSNFCALRMWDRELKGTTGQTSWVMLEEPEIEGLLMRVNGIPNKRDRRYLWLVAPSSRIYVTGGDDPKTAKHFHWPRIGLASGVKVNQVRVLEASDDMRLVRVEGIPHGSDYRGYSPATHPWLFHYCNCIYGDSIGDNPTGYQLYMPILDPASGYQISKGGNGLWMERSWLKAKVEESMVTGKMMFKYDDSRIRSLPSLQDEVTGFRDQAAVFEPDEIAVRDDYIWAHDAQGWSAIGAANYVEPA